MDQRIMLVLAAAGLLLGAGDPAWARGFGGYQGRTLGGGFQGGGFEGGSFGDGGIQIRNFQAGAIGSPRSAISGFPDSGFRGPELAAPAAPALPGVFGFPGGGPAMAGDRGATFALPTDAGIYAVGGSVFGGPAGFDAAPEPARPAGPRLSSQALAGVIARTAPPRAEGLVGPAHEAHAVAPLALHAAGLAAQRNGCYGDLFSPVWHAAHPGAWSATGLASARADTTWAGVNAWFGVDWPLNYYDYGNAITFTADVVCFDRQPVASAAAFAQAAIDLAASGGQPADDGKQPWLPLGVFGLLADGEKTIDIVFQLAVDKAGLVRGNFCRTAEQSISPIQGAVDKRTQRIAWSVGGNKDVVFDTGLYNLTREETPVLVHLGRDQTQQCALVRLKMPSQTPGQRPAEPVAPDSPGIGPKSPSQNPGQGPSEPRSLDSPGIGPKQPPAGKP